MKKKILTILCAICLILPCAFVFSGCDADKYAGQITQIETQVGNLNTNLDETNSNLCDIETEIGNLNGKLEEVSNTLDKLQKDLTVDEAWGLYQLGFARISLGANGVWDNFKMHYIGTHTELDHPNEVDGPVYYELILYKGSEESVLIAYDANYDDGSINYAYKSDVTEAGEYSYTAFVNQMLADCGFGYNTEFFTRETLVSVETLDNGNYKLYAVVEAEDNYIMNNVALYEVEITSDGYLVSMNFLVYDELGSTDTEDMLAVYSFKLEFSYGDVTQTEVDALVNTPGAHPYPSFA